MNHVTLIGRLGRDPEVRFTQGGQAVANFSMATTQVYKDKEGKRKEATQWHRITTWGKLAENVGEYLGKGRLVCVTGRLEYSEYTDKENVKRATSAIVASAVEFLDSAKSDRKIEAPASTIESNEQHEDVPDVKVGDSPF